MFGGLKKLVSSPFKLAKDLIEGPKLPKPDKIADEDPDIARLKAVTGGDGALEALRKRLAAARSQTSRAGLIIPRDDGGSGLRL